MNYPLPNQNQPSLLIQDTSKIRNETLGYFQQGDMKWNKGDTIEIKEDGCRLILQGLKSLKIWISRETDPAMKDYLNRMYGERYKLVDDNLKYLDNYKKGNVVTDNHSTGGQQQLKRPNQGSGQGQGGEKDKDNEDNAKLKNALSEAIVTEKPNVKWEDIAGLVQAKQSLQEAVILPIKFPQIFEGARKPWKGILLYGPPGTGKTYLAKACATEADGTFFSVSSSDLISKYVGESEKFFWLIKTLFALGREKKPSIIFIDEIDSMCGSRGEGQNEASRRVITEFLVQMQGVGHDDKGLLVLGATNLPWALDSAIRRRFEKRIYIPLPDETARTYMIKNALKSNKHSISEQDLIKLGNSTEGYSGSDISILVRDAVYEPVRKLQTSKKFKEVQIEGKTKLTPADESENGPSVKQMSFMDISPDQLWIPDVSMIDFQKCLNKTKSSVSKDQLKEYEDWTKQFGQEG